MKSCFMNEAERFLNFSNSTFDSEYNPQKHLFTVVPQKSCSKAVGKKHRSQVITGQPVHYRSVWYFQQKTDITHATACLRVRDTHKKSTLDHVVVSSHVTN